MTRWIAEPAAVHAPDAGQMHFRDYALLRQQPRTIRHWAIVVGSALLGSSSHVVLDDALDRVGGMPYYSLAASPAWMVANVLLWLVLAWITVGLLRHIGRHRLVQRWALHRTGVEAVGEHPRGPHPPASPGDVEPLTPVTTPARFWGLVLFCAIASAGLGAHYRRPGYFMHQGATWIHIWLISVGGAFTGLLLASITWQGTRARPRNLERGQ